MDLKGVTFEHLLLGGCFVAEQVSQDLEKHGQVLFNTRNESPPTHSSGLHVARSVDQCLRQNLVREFYSITAQVPSLTL